jgi:signal transduction histidine kinase
LAGSSITLKEHTGDPLELRCDPEELAQMVGELLANAIKYSPGGHIAVAAEATREGLAIEVSDDGPGLSADQRSASTSRFWRAPQHSGIPGNGLGLTIVERLAEANGGRLVLRERIPHGLIGRLEFGGGANG